MKLSSAFSMALVYSGICSALEEAQDVKRSASSADLTARGSTCSIGIGRVSGSINWDATIYNVARADRQDVNLIGIATFVAMDKGESMTVTGPPDVKITNVDNAPVFTYNVPILQAPLDDPKNGITKVELRFESGSANWTSSDCSAGNVIFSAGRESWSCDFAC